MKKFTLLELLVVIAIIGILSTMLLPSLRSARKAAMISVSVSNLGQIYKATMGYAGAHNGRVVRSVTPDLHVASSGGSNIQYSWDDSLMEGYLGTLSLLQRLSRYPEYNDTFEVLKCPLDDIESVYPAGAPSSVGRKRYRRSYSFNSVEFNGNPILAGIGEIEGDVDYRESMFLAQVESGAETILMSEISDYKNQVGTHYRVAFTRVNRLTDVNIFYTNIDGKDYKQGLSPNHHDNGFRNPYLFVDGAISIMSVMSTLENDKHLWRTVKQ